MNEWRTAPCKKGNLFSARTGHAVTAYHKTARSEQEMQNRYAFLSTQYHNIPYLPCEVNLNIFSFLEEPKSKKIYVFGGTSENEKLNDLHEYNVESGEWKEVIPTSKEEVSTIPKYRSGTRGCMIGKLIYIFGGCNVRNGRGNYFNDLWSVNIDTFEWKLEARHSFKPLTRADYSMIVYKNNLILFGGYDGRMSFNGISIYNPDTECWKMIKACGEIPSKRFGHSASLYKDSMYVFGGWDGAQTLSTLHEFQFETGHWNEIKINGFPPPHRYRHTSVVYNDCLFICGGVDSEKRRFNDLWCFNFLTKSWTVMELTGEIKSQSFHGAIVLDDQMYVVGGYDGAHRLNDVHYCSLKF